MYFSYLPIRVSKNDSSDYKKIMFVIKEIGREEPQRIDENTYIIIIIVI